MFDPIKTEVYMGGSNEYPQSYVLSRNMKNIWIRIWILNSYLKIFSFQGKIFSIFKQACTIRHDCLLLLLVLLVSYVQKLWHFVGTFFTIIWVRSWRVT